MKLPTPVFMPPIGVIGLCSQDFHGDIAVAKASAQTGVPMAAGTLTQDRMEDVIPHAGDTPALFQLYTPTRATRTWQPAFWVAPRKPDIRPLS